MRLYPDRLALRLWYALADLVALGWMIMWLSVANFVYNTVMALTVIAQGIKNAGLIITQLVLNFEQSAQQNVPFLGDWLAGLARQIGGVSGSPLVDFGNAGLVAIHNLAVALTILIGLPPILAGLVTYLPWRWRHTREFASLHRIVRRVPPVLEDDALRILAARALYSLPFHVLLAYSRNPIEEFATGHYENLARATMAEHGLDLDRYLSLPEPRPSMPAVQAGLGPGPGPGGQVT
jgi:hypothetical protein